MTPADPGGGEPAIATPFGGPIAAHWDGVYDHVFIALHPFLRDVPDHCDDRHRYEIEATLATVPWSDVASEIGAPDFADFAMATMLAAYGMSADARPANASVRPTQEVIDAIGRRALDKSLGYPADDYVAPSFFADIAEIAEAVGETHVEVWDEFRGSRADVPLDRFRRGDLCGFLGRPAAVAVADRSFLFDCSFLSMDHMWSAVAFRSDVRDVMRPEDRFEGFYVSAATTPNWVNEPGTFEPPSGWRA